MAQSPCQRPSFEAPNTPPTPFNLRLCTTLPHSLTHSLTHGRLPCSHRTSSPTQLCRNPLYPPYCRYTTLSPYLPCQEPEPSEVVKPRAAPPPLHRSSSAPAMSPSENRMLWMFDSFVGTVIGSDRTDTTDDDYSSLWGTACEPLTAAGDSDEGTSPRNSSTQSSLLDVTFAPRFTASLREAPSIFPAPVH